MRTKRMNGMRGGGEESWGEVRRREEVGPMEARWLEGERCGGEEG